MDYYNQQKCSMIQSDLDLIKRDNSNKKLIMLVGCSGSGKSTIPHNMRINDPGYYYLVDENFVIGTVMPKFGIIALGRYRDGINCGGCDGIQPQAKILDSLVHSWNSPFDILMEGLLIISGRWLQRIEHLGEELGHRKIYVISLIITPEEAYKRVLSRNGGKTVNMANIENKITAAKRFPDNVKRINHLPGCIVKTKIMDTTNIQKDEMLYHFFENIK